MFVTEFKSPPKTFTFADCQVQANVSICVSDPFPDMDADEIAWELANNPPYQEVMDELQSILGLVLDTETQAQGWGNHFKVIGRDFFKKIWHFLDPHEFVSMRGFSFDFKGVSVMVSIDNPMQDIELGAGRHQEALQIDPTILANAECYILNKSGTFVLIPRM